MFKLKNNYKKTSSTETGVIDGNLLHQSGAQTLPISNGMKLFFTYKQKKAQGGFTLVETLVAILILAICVNAVMSLAAGGFFSVRYSKNQIVATALAQEALEYVRNTRDTLYKQPAKTWDDWRKMFNVGPSGVSSPDLSANRGCWSVNGCNISPYATTAKATECVNIDCSPLYYYPNAFGVAADGTALGFYGYVWGSAMGTYPNNVINSTGNYVTTYKRIVKMTLSPNPKEATVTVTVKWMDGNTQRSLSQSILITDWRP